MGILLDLEKCNLEGLYKDDAGVSRIDIEKRFISWSRSLKNYVLWCDNKVPVLDPDIRHKAAGVRYKVDSITDIKSYMQNIALKRSPVSHNEVVIGYNRESIIGIAAVINNEPGRGNATNEQILADSRQFKLIILDKLGMDVPTLIYDCRNGELSLNT